MSIEIKETAFATVIAKTVTVPVDLAKMPEHVLHKIIAYGVQRIYNDAVGGSEKFPTVDAKVAHVKEMIKRHEAGDIGRQRGTGVDAITTECRKLARQALKAHLPKEEYKAKITDGDAAKVNDILDKIVAKNKDGFEKRAKAAIAQREAERKAAAEMVGDLDIDLD